MAARSIGSLIITFGLVAVPVKIYTATSAKQLAFNMLHDKAGCHSRLGQLMTCKAESEEKDRLVVVQREETIRGYEYAPDQYVTFTNDEMKQLEAERDDSLEILQFVPSSSVDLVQVEKSQYLGPDKGGDRAYRLLSLAMVDTKTVGLGRWKTKAKDTLVIIRPFADGGLALHQIYYASEVRDFSQIDRGAPAISPSERQLARQLIEQLYRPTLDTKQFTDGWAETILKQVERKVAGEQIVVPAVRPQAERFDLLEALQRSVGSTAPPSGKGPRKAVTRAKAQRARRAG